MIYSEKVIDQMEVQIAEQLSEIDNLKDRIAELEKQSEPVAWMATSKVIVLEPMEGLIPLYKHPPQTKPLSAEDIAEMVCSGEYWKVAGLTILSVDFDKFARAIEERHGIK